MAESAGLPELFDIGSGGAGLPSGVVFYWERPEYASGAPPKYGIPIEEAGLYIEFWEHVPTQTVYLFKSILTIPSPPKDWNYIGKYIPEETWEDIGLDSGVLNRFANLVSRGLDAVMDDYVDLLDDVTSPIYAVIEWIGGQVNERIETGQSDLGAGFLAIMSLIGLTAIGGNLGVIGGIESVVSSVYGWMKDVKDKLAPLIRSVGEKIADAKAFYQQFAKAVHLEELRTLDHILSLTWDTYYEKKQEIIGGIGTLSFELFGDLHVLNQWFALAGMLWKDYASITGKTWGEQDMEWFTKVNDFLLDVEDELEYYARHPDRFWVRIEHALVRPIYEERAAEFSRWDAFRARLDTGMETIDQFSKSLDRKLFAYQLALPENIEGVVGPELLALRKDLREVYTRGLRPVLMEIEDRLDLAEPEIRAIQRFQALSAPRIERNSMLLSNPATLEPEEQDEQAQVMNRIQTALMQRWAPVSERVMRDVSPNLTAAIQRAMESIP